MPLTPPERSQRLVREGNGRARSAIEQLLLQRADEFELIVRVDPVAREQMVSTFGVIEMVFERCAFLPQERSVRSNFHIPKMLGEPSRSLLDVTSSTQHDNEQQHYQENETRRSSSGCYSNYRHDAPEARGHGSPLRFEIAQ